MINLIDIRYVRLGTPDLESAVRYSKEIVGLEEVSREGKASYLRGDDRDHNLVYFEGDPTEHTTGFEVATTAELDSAAAELEQAGHRVHVGAREECELRRVKAFINFKDPTGNSIDLTVRPYWSGRRYFPSRDAGITEFSHIGLRTSDAPRDETFWTTHFNIRASDWIGDAPLLTFDRVHHRMAMFPSRGPGVQHINFQVESIDDVMRSYYYLVSKMVRIVFGPGRHPPSTAMFVYFEGPDGMTFEYSFGVKMIDLAEHRPRQFPFRDESFCMWGAKPDIKEFKS